MLPPEPPGVLGISIPASGALLEDTAVFVRSAKRIFAFNTRDPIVVDDLPLALFGGARPTIFTMATLLAEAKADDDA